MNELKPCPFCGSEEVRMRFDSVFESYCVTCRNCGAKVFQFYGLKDAAVEAWNRRADDV
jgi:Lar family restriction alleviation protein